MLFQKRIRMQKKRRCSLPAQAGLRSPLEPDGTFERASVHTSHRGSLTVECALLLPLFLLGMLTLISFMNLYQMQTEKLLELCGNARKAGMYAYAAGGPDEITLPAVYSYESPVAVIPLPKVWMYNSVTVHSWTGRDSTADGGEGQQAAEEMVYVTEHGGVFHTSADCRHLDLSIRQTAASGVEDLRNQYGEKYRPCEHCSAAGGTGGLVYITDTGNRYHTAAGCSGLKRTVRLVKKSEAGNLPLCKTCAAAH